MAKKVILDVDPHVDAAVALALALFDPELEVVAVTATAGCVAASQAPKNIQAGQGRQGNPTRSASKGEIGKTAELVADNVFKFSEAW